MKKFGLLVLVLALGAYLTGCGKKEPSLDETMQEPMSMEALSTMNATETKSIPEVKSGDVKSAQEQVITQASEPKLEPLPPQGPYKPTGTEVQTALKNAGFYTGTIDGKIGPKTKKAIEEFQAANGLKADGKVGPKTWGLLGKHLIAPESAVEGQAPAKKKR